MNESDKLEIINRISSLRSAGRTFQEIADVLQGEGVPTFSGKGIWRRQQIHKILNPPKATQKKPIKRLVKVGKTKELEDKILSLEKDKSVLSERIVSLENELDKSAKKIVAAVSEFDRRTLQLDDERKENERLQKQVTQLIKVGKNVDSSLEALEHLKSIVNELKEENVLLKDTIEGLVKLVKNPPFPSVPANSVPDYLDVGNGDSGVIRWGIQKKNVGSYTYYYANKKIDGKLHSLSVGRVFNTATATDKIKKYMATKLSCEKGLS